MVARLLPAFFAAALLALVSVACDGAPREEPAPAAQTPSRAPSPSAAAFNSGPGSVGSGEFTASARSIVETYRIVVIATPIRTNETVPLPGTVAKTIYELQVDQVINGHDAIERDTINLILTGGQLNVPDHPYYPVENPPTLGRKYLFFLYDLRDKWPNGFSAWQGVRFEISDDGYLFGSGSDQAPGIRAISGITEEQLASALASESPRDALKQMEGQTLERAIAVVEAALAEGPVPAYPEYWDEVPGTPVARHPVPTRPNSEATAEPSPTPTPVPSATPDRTQISTPAPSAAVATTSPSIEPTITP